MKFTLPYCHHRLSHSQFDSRSSCNSSNTASSWEYPQCTLQTMSHRYLPIVVPTCRYLQSPRHRCPETRYQQRRIWWPAASQSWNRWRRLFGSKDIEQDGQSCETQTSHCNVRMWRGFVCQRLVWGARWPAGRRKGVHLPHRRWSLACSWHGDRRCGRRWHDKWAKRCMDNGCTSCRWAELNNIKQALVD